MTDDQVWALVRVELVRARHKFPAPDYMLAAVFEEVGEMARAVLHEVAETEPDPDPDADVAHEGVQAIATIVRLLTEGDLVHNLPPR